MFRRAKALAVLVLLVLPLAACGARSEASGSVLRVARAESFDGWDPDKASTYASYQTLNGVLEPLLRMNADGKSLDPGIAREWSHNRNETAWTFMLRKDVRFSDGSALSSADVAFSQAIWRQGPNYGNMYAKIARVETPDPHTVRFVLDGPDSAFPVLMAWSSSAVFPKDFGGRDRKAYFDAPIGAGAFTVEKWSPGGRIVLHRNPFYYLPGRPYLERIVIDVVDEDADVLFQAGQEDIVEYLTALDAKKFGSRVVGLPPSQLEHLSFRTTTGPLRDQRVRAAIAHAIDYRAIQHGAFREHSTLPNGILPPDLPNWMPPSRARPAHDPAKARTLLRQAGLRAPVHLEVVYDAGNPVDELIGQVLQADLAEVGITLKLSGLETGTFLSRAYGLDADMVLWSYGPVSPDIMDPLSWLSGTSWLFSGMDTRDVLDVNFAYRATDDPAKKRRLIAGLQDAARTRLPAIGLAQFQVLHAVSARVHGFHPEPWGMYYWDTIKVGRS
ncbi:ABC transporter substrate-binding protein [Sciscionella sediminilitoris]|uniref:ABC transporter substrate-binding protein n=1 Tax=Sciscionella sediminilitoris TaxID=1445613 RepID=UPI0012E1CB2E|nr:ABC transporter substrate-binding protein [Sciscionella sp. SE31]